MLLIKQYRATGRGFVVRHIKFAENYRLYSRSHFVKAWVLHPINLICEFSPVPRTVIWYSFIHRLEVALLLIVYLAYGYTSGSTTSFILLTLSSWFLVISWLFAPYIFNPSGFEWQKYVISPIYCSLWKLLLYDPLHAFYTSSSFTIPCNFQNSFLPKEQTWEPWWELVSL